jgi:putative ABC transport system permease protein
MGSVIALVSLLVVLLSGLTAGLSAQSISALDRLPADRLAFATPPSGQQLSFSTSNLSAEQVASWTGGVGGQAAPLGVASARMSLPGSGSRTGSPDASADTSAGHDVPVTVFGAQPGSFVAPPQLAEGTTVISSELAKTEGLRTGDTVRLGRHDLRVTAVRDDSSFNHTPVVWTTLDVWHGLDSAAGAAATVVALRGDTAGDAAAQPVAGFTVTSRTDARAAVGSYTAENGSLTLMRLLLLAISALVVGAFFTVWTVQRTPDLAVLKAIGASSSALVRDALGQSLVVLVVGGGIGTALAAVAGTAAARVVPFVVSAGTTVLPFAALLVVGLVGAAAAVRRIISVDPLTALGAAR